MQLSENEMLIMKLLWKEDRPMTRAEILKGTEGRNWNPASIHLILNSMISKGAIRITDEEKKYGRTYETCVNREDYARDAVKALFPGASMAEILKMLVNGCKKELTKSETDEIMEIFTNAGAKGKKRK